MALKVCVIGAGAAGLCAARHLLGSNFQAQVYEQSKVVGGTWVYTEATGIDDRGNPIHSSMYKNLRTNLPKEVMAFPDFPFPDHERSFLPHEDVRAYLEQYCDHYGLRKFIKFEHKILQVEPQANSNDPTSWVVSSKCLKSGNVNESTYDAVLVCNGHYSEPAYPSVRHIDQFKGTQMHSHNYRTPDPFENKTVIVLGAGASGMDISLEVASQASLVYLSHNNPTLPTKLPKNIVQVPGIIECITDHGFLLADGSKVQVDALLYCTGYEFCFPFLSNKCSLKIENRQMYPLYKHMIHADYPTIAFIGLPLTIVPFILFDRQIQWFTSILAKASSLPSSDEMKAEIQREKESRKRQGIPDKHFHVFKDYQWEYNAELATLANIPELPRRIENLYKLAAVSRRKCLATYKDMNYELENDEYVPIKKPVIENS